MTFGEKRRALRAFRRVADRMRAEVNACGFRNPPASLTLSADEWDAVEFGMMHMKVWIPELDDEQEVIPGSGRRERMNFLYRKSSEPREHFLFKCVPVFRA